MTIITTPHLLELIGGITCAGFLFALWLVLVSSARRDEAEQAALMEFIERKVAQ